MKSKKSVSIILSAVFFACAIAFIVVCVYICSNSQDILSLLVGSVIVDLIVVLTLLCLASTVVLLLSAIKKARPVAIAIYSAGALFSAVPSLVYFIYVVSQIGESDGLVFIILSLAASAITFIAGIFTCVFASRLNRSLLKAAQPELPVETPAEEAAPIEPVSEEQQ